MRNMYLKVQTHAKRWPYRLSESCGHSEQWNGCDLCSIFFHVKLGVKCPNESGLKEGSRGWSNGARGCLLNKLRCDFVRHTYSPFGVKKQLVESDAGKMYLIIVSQMPKMCFREMLCTCSRI
jgi:hypothetical protein